jgi:hypothetical protein
MFPLQVGRANIFGVVQVFAEKPEQIHVIAPHGSILYFIVAANADADGSPVIVDVPMVIERKEFEKLCLPCFQQSFGFIFYEQELEEIKWGQAEKPFGIITSFNFGD